MWNDGTLLIFFKTAENLAKLCNVNYTFKLSDSSAMYFCNKIIELLSFTTNM